MNTTASTLPLLCHPATPCPLPLRLLVTLDWQAAGLVLHYQVTGPLDGVKLPGPVPIPPGPTDGLWQHSCLEAFVSPVQAAHYREFNFSPSQQWAAYCFSAERERDAAAETGRPIQPGIRLSHSPGQFELWATLPEAALPPGQRLCLGLSAVIETHGGHLSYWALQHPRAERPDFHHRGGWREMARPTPTSPNTSA